MKNFIRLIGGLFLFWICFFFCLRILFIAVQLFFGYRIDAFELPLALMNGSYMDLSMASYFMIIPLILYFVNKWIPYSRIIFIYTSILIVIISTIYSGDAVLYREWGFRLDKSAFTYLTEFHEAASFVSIGNSITMVLLIVFNTAMGIIMFRKFYFKYSSVGSNWIYVFNFLLLPLLIIPMRGGLDIIPMNPGKVYFSSKPFSNHVALNVPWNILYSALQMNNPGSDLKFMKDEQVDEILKNLFATKNDHVDTVLNSQRPKVLFLVLESFTAKLIHKEFEGIEVTPRLNDWFESGIYLNKAYATGDRTEIGMASIFSGFPAQPQSAIVQYPRKSAHLPSLIQKMKQVGYKSSFYYGGDASFASMSSYFFNMGCDEIIDKHQFPKSSYNAKWGVHDHILFEKLYDDIISDSLQFLKICLSLSSHPPYDFPEAPIWKSKEEEILFLNTAHYTDKHLGILLDKLKQLPLWDELLVVLSADHGARFPDNDQYQTPQKFRIPIWLGGGVVTKQFKMNQVVSQNDIAATVLYQLGLTNDEFIFSNNIFSKSYKPFAYYAFNNGFGWVDEGGVQVFSNDQKEIILKERNPVMDIQTGKAFLQKVLNEFNRM